MTNDHPVEDLSSIISRLRRSYPRNLDTLVVCEALEARLIEESKPKSIAQQHQPSPRTDYQRQYMRDMRAAKKLGLTTEEYRAKAKKTPDGPCGDRAGG